MPKSRNCLFCVIGKRFPISCNSQRFAEFLKTCIYFAMLTDKTWIHIYIVIFIALKMKFGGRTAQQFQFLFSN